LERSKEIPVIISVAQFRPEKVGIFLSILWTKGTNFLCGSFEPLLVKPIWHVFHSNVGTLAPTWGFFSCH